MALTLGQKSGWGLADMGIVTFVVVKQLLVLTYLTAYLVVPVGIAGFVTTAVLICDMITDPLVGYLSDRTQSRYGRRARWLRVWARQPNWSGSSPFLAWRPWGSRWWRSPTARSLAKSRTARAKDRP